MLLLNKKIWANLINLSKKQQIISFRWFLIFSVLFHKWHTATCIFSMAVIKQEKGKHYFSIFGFALKRRNDNTVLFLVRNISTSWVTHEDWGTCQASWKNFLSLLASLSTTSALSLRLLRLQMLALDTDSESIPKSLWMWRKASSRRACWKTGADVGLMIITEWQNRKRWIIIAQWLKS